MREALTTTPKVAVCYPNDATCWDSSTTRNRPAGSKLDRLAILLAQVLALGIAGCGGSDSDTAVAQGGSEPAPAPVPAPAPAPTPSPAPAPGSYSVSLSWAAPELNTDGTSLTDVSGYRISHGTSSSNLNQQLAVNGAGATTATVTGLAAGTHFFSIRTLNSSGVASDASGVVSKTVP